MFLSLLPTKKFPSRELLILDEAHLLEDRDRKDLQEYLFQKENGNDIFLISRWSIMDIMI